jgi:hypothetical protein
MTTLSSITDIPKLAKSDDHFGIKPFESGLTEFIKKTSTPITIALQGEWGSGKTSLMNSLQSSLSGDKTESDFHSVWLNTWEYSLMKDASDTLIDIITGLIKETSIIAKMDESETRKLIGKVLNIGKNFTKFAAKTALNKTIDGVGDEIESLFSSNEQDSIGQIRNQLEAIISTCIKKDNKKGFIFFIDDLDRIDPPVAVQLLELLKNIFTLKDCVFVLAIDYDVIIKGLEPKFGKLTDTNEREFRSFFDKIIQVPFSMPVSNYNIEDFLKESLVSINYVEAKYTDNKEFISLISEISKLTVGTNPRALKRLMNSLSLIRIINNARGNSEESDQLNEELELVVNYALVSIQIAYPSVYRLLNLNPGYDNWNESVALQMNLKELDEYSKLKLSKSDEFDEEWEQIIFRLCENDHYLKKRALDISNLLNKLKKYIIDKSESVEDIIGSLISLSSVTSVEAFDQPKVDYHKGELLKNIRSKILPKLRLKLPEIKNIINNQGARVQSNAYIKFTDKDWGRWIQLCTSPHNGKIRLQIITHIWFKQKTSSFLADLKSINAVEKFNSIENEMIQFVEKFDDKVQMAKWIDGNKITSKNNHKKEPFHFFHFNVNLNLNSVQEFYSEENLNLISDIAVNMQKSVDGLSLIQSQLND